METTPKLMIDFSSLKDLSDPERLVAIEDLRQQLHELSPVKTQPVDRIRWVPIDMVQPNDYNPNSVAKVELGLLYTSILHDGYTQPVVTIWDETVQKYVIIDGFHRYFTCRNNQDIRDRNCGMLPIVVLDKPINDRMASTVRHNRARGKHSVDGMSNMVFQMLENGWSEAEICAELGMEAEEVLRLKHITGFSKLFENMQYKKAWETKTQLKLRKQAEKEASV
jgi:ParB-like chromosome segregation protein Spo0J